MHAWARWTIAAIALTLSASVAPSARAAFGECSSPDYLALFDERLREVGYDCVERMRQPVHSRSGLRHIRIVHDRNADWILDDATMAGFERGVRDAADAFERLGGLDLEDVTLLLADDFPPRDDADRFSNIAANADIDNDGECHVIVYLAGPGGTAEYAAFIAAHEIFHCVQAANLSPAQMGSGSTGEGGGGDWWLEGSANWFAAFAIPDTGPFADYIAAFDLESPTTPLNRMAYGAVVFFFWLADETSPNGVMMFLSGMAPSSAESAQRAAMASALSQEQWLDFAESYIDNEIREPHGGRVPLFPSQGEIWEWSVTQTRTAPLEPFVIHRGVVAFQCGRWGTSVTPAAAHSARPEDGGEWGALPNAIDTTSGSGGSYSYVAVNTGPARASLSVAGTLEAGCGDCMGVRELDACVVGSWRLTSGGAVEWMRRQGVVGTYSTTNEGMTFRSDGSFITQVVDGEGHYVSESGTRADGELRVQAGGRWSAREGGLNVCPDMQAASGQTTYTTPEGQRRTVPVPSMPPQNMQSRYSCSGDTLRTEIAIPGAPPMVSEYSRVGE